MRAHSSISDLSPVSRKMWVVELCSDLVQEDADIFRLGPVGRQGENLLQLPAKMRAHPRFPKGSDLGFFEFALVRRQGAASKTTILRHQFHPEYPLDCLVREHGCESAPIAISRRGGRASPFMPLLRLKLPTQAFVPYTTRRPRAGGANGCLSPARAYAQLQAERRPIGLR